ADKKDHRPCFETADRFIDVADGKDSDSIEAEPFERILERLRHVLDHHDDRRGPGGGGATYLIFEQASSGERQQRAKGAIVVLLIGADQRADGHFLLIPPRASPRALSNRFLAASKMVNCHSR